MTSDEFLSLREGDLVRFTKDIEINGYKWKFTDLCQVVYNEVTNGEGVVTYYLKNLTWEKEGRIPYVQQFGAWWFLNYVHKVTTVHNMNKTIVEHKFKVGDIVWFMHDNKPHSQTVTDLEVSWHKDISKVLADQNIKPCIRYHLYGTLHDTWYYENQLFATKDELLDSLR